MPASAALATAVTANTPKGKRRHTLSGIVGHPLSTTYVRLNSTDPGRAAWKPTSEPKKRATASPMSTSGPKLGRTKENLLAVAKDDMALQVYRSGRALWPPPKGGLISTQ